MRRDVRGCSWTSNVLWLRGSQWCPSEYFSFLSALSDSPCCARPHFLPFERASVHTFLPFFFSPSSLFFLPPSFRLLFPLSLHADYYYSYFFVRCSQPPDRSQTSSSTTTIVTLNSISRSCTTAILRCARCPLMFSTWSRSTRNPAIFVASTAIWLSSRSWWWVVSGGSIHQLPKWWTPGSGDFIQLCVRCVRTVMIFI